MTDKCPICASNRMCPGCGHSNKCECVFLDFFETTNGTTTSVSKIEPENRRIASALFPEEVPTYIVLFRCCRPLGDGKPLDVIHFHVHYEGGGYVSSGSQKQSLGERAFHL